MTHIDDQGHVVMDVTRADGTHEDIYRKFVHLGYGPGAPTKCGISWAQAQSEYAYDAPVCPVCGPRGGSH